LRGVLGMVTQTMCLRLPSCLAVCLALIVALTSVTMAQARHHPRAMGTVELCTGVGMVAVSVDAQGNPVGPMVPCPDCTPALAALPGPGPKVTGPAMRLVPLRNRPGAALAPFRRVAGFRLARAPPLAV